MQFSAQVRAAATEAQNEAKAYTDRGLLEALYIMLRRNEILQANATLEAMVGRVSVKKRLGSSNMEWRSMKDAPRDGTHVLLYLGEFEPEFSYGWPEKQKLSVFEGFYNDDDCWITIIRDEDWGVSSDPGYTSCPARLLPLAWMPLPAPPDGEL